MRRDDDGVWSAHRSTRRGRERPTSSRSTSTSRPTDAVETNLVTDPYSVALTTDSARSVVVDLDDPSLRPAGWNDAAQARTRASRRTRRSTSCTCATSRSTTRPCRPTHRGTYLAFTDAGSDGMQHLRASRRRRAQHRAPAAGVRHRHDPGGPRRPGDPGLRSRVLRARRRRSSRPASTRSPATDGFNWGYDPWHYTTPEGSYATEPGGPDPHARSSARWSPG